MTYQKPLITNKQFVQAFKKAIRQGHIVIGIGNYDGWQEDCDCEKCKSQKMVYEFVRMIKDEHSRPDAEIQR